MRNKIKKLITESIETEKLLFSDEKLIAKIEKSAELISQALKNGGKVLIFGNGEALRIASILQLSWLAGSRKKEKPWLL